MRRRTRRICTSPCSSSIRIGGGGKGARSTRICSSRSEVPLRDARSEAIDNRHEILQFVRLRQERVEAGGLRTLAAVGGGVGGHRHRRGEVTCVRFAFANQI